MMIIFSSDLHGSVSGYKHFTDYLSLDSYDLGILGGDLMGKKRKSLTLEEDVKAVLEKAGKPILFIMGNYDGILGHSWTETGLIKNINMKKKSIKGQSFVGYQFTNPFIGGEFEKSETDQQTDMIQLKELIDNNTILVTHGPAYGILDRTNFGYSAGSRALLNLFDQVKPKLHLFGHIHESAGIKDFSVNAAYQQNRQFVSIDTENMGVKFIE